MGDAQSFLTIASSEYDFVLTTLDTVQQTLPFFLFGHSSDFLLEGKWDSFFSFAKAEVDYNIGSFLIQEKPCNSPLSLSLSLNRD